MKIFTFCLILALSVVLVNSVNIKVDFEAPYNKWQHYFAGLFSNPNRAAFRDAYLSKLKEYAHDGFKKPEEKAMGQEIAEEFLRKLYPDQLTFSETEVRDQVDGEFQQYIKKWVTNMYYGLLDIYELDRDEELLEMMLKDPEYYGLTYDSWKILTFDFDQLERMSRKRNDLAGKLGESTDRAHTHGDSRRTVREIHETTTTTRKYTTDL